MEFLTKLFLGAAQIVLSQAATSAQNMIAYQVDRVKATAHGKSSENSPKLISKFCFELFCYKIFM